MDDDAYFTQIQEDFDLTEEEVREQYETERDNYLSNYVGPADEIENMEDYIHKQALKMTRSHFLAQEAMRGGGRVVECLAYGNTGIQMWADKDDPSYDENKPRDQQPKKPVLLGNALVGIDGRISKASVVIDGNDGVDLEEAKSYLQVGRTFSAKLSVQEGSLENSYVLWSTEDTEFDPETEDIPTDQETKRALLKTHADEARLMEITDCLSARDPQSGYSLDFGIDIKRIRGQVVDLFIPDEAGKSAIYTLHDESHMTEQELEHLPLTTEKQRTTGLTCWTPQDQVEYGVGSICDFYGSITEGKDGRITMNTCGIVPLFPKPVEDADDENVTSTKAGK